MRKGPQELRVRKEPLEPKEQPEAKALLVRKAARAQPGLREPQVPRELQEPKVRKG